MMKKLMSVAAATALLASPTLASANPAGMLSLSNAAPVKSATSVKKGSRQAEALSPLFLIAGAVAVVVVLEVTGVINLVGGDDDAESA